MAFIYVVKVEETKIFLPESYFIFYLAFLNFVFVAAFATFFMSIKSEKRDERSEVARAEVLTALEAAAEFGAATLQTCRGCTSLSRPRAFSPTSNPQHLNNRGS